MQPRYELFRGIIILLGLVGFIILSDLIFTDYFSTSDYASVKPEVLINNPEEYEDVLISTIVRVESVQNHSSEFYLVETIEGITLLSPVELGGYNQEGDVVLRGRSHLASTGYVEVSEFYILDSSAAIMRSIPGLLVFIVIFFLIFRIDIGDLAFVPRRV
jgi:hypothetical protein